MPRQSRIDAPGAFHHLIIRGIERKTIFKDDADRYGFIERIESIFSRIAINPSFRRKYREFVEGGIGAGRRPELVGGGLIRSVGAWKQAKILLKGQERVEGDERILGDTDFVQNVLKRCTENYLRKYRLAAQGVELETLSKGVAAYFNLTCDQLNTPGRYPAVVQARSVLCFLAVRQLGLTATELARKIGLTQPAINISVKRGEGIVKERGFDIADILP
jgi:hypothetical protein